MLADSFYTTSQPPLRKGLPTPLLIRRLTLLVYHAVMNDGVVIRLYAPRDRASVRRICQDTADRGSPVPGFYPDGELVADLVTRYYTDIESRYSWVAEVDGRVVGYITATVDTRAFRRMEHWRIGPLAILKAILRGALFTRAAWAMLTAAVKPRGKAVIPHPPLPPAYPAHLHINIVDGFRGQHVGERLIEASLSQMEKAGVPGVHAGVRADNPRACAFFEHMDFKAVGHYDLVLPSQHGVQIVRNTLYGRRFG